MRTGALSVCSTRAWNGIGRTFPAGDVDPPDLALAPDHNRSAVRCPRARGVQTVDRPRLLQILVDVRDLPIATRLEVPDVEEALETNPANVGERLAVGRDLRRHRAALRLTARRSASRQILADDGVDGAAWGPCVLEGLAA